MVSFCTYCGQKFTRDEHLERHILTHTNVKPFRCHQCNMSFARRDLLNRHYTVHGRDNNQESSNTPGGFAPRSAGRTPIACTNCAKTKTKCDKKTPCSRCSARNLECQSRPTRRTTKNTNLLADSTPETQANKEKKLSPPGLESPEDDAGQGSPEDDTYNSPVADGGGMSIDPSSAQILGGYPFQENSGPPQGLDPLLANTYGPGPVLSPALTPGSSAMSGMPMHSLDATMFSGPRQSFNTPLAQSMSQYPSGWQQTDVEQINMEDMHGTTSFSFPMGDGFGNAAMTDCSPLSTNLYMAGHDWMNSPVSPNVNGFPSTSQFLRSPPPSANSESPSVAGQSNGEAEDIVKCRDGWCAFSCNPRRPSRHCPDTSAFHITALQETLKDPFTWTKCMAGEERGGDESSNHYYLSITDFEPEVRDKLSAIAQQFLHQGLKKHPSTGSNNNIARTLMLPSISDLNYLLKCYGNVTERYYPLTSNKTLDPNKLMSQKDDKPPSVLLLLMISQGALLSGLVDGRWLAGGLVEMCRISLFDLIEKNFKMAGDVVCQHAALLWIMQAAWSGDKWQLDIANSQRRIYIKMLQHHGYPQTNLPPGIADYKCQISGHWRVWSERERRSRTFYSWFVIDQELSLFHDEHLSISWQDCTASMPDAEHLWLAENPTLWKEIFESIHTFADGGSAIGRAVTPSLSDLFTLFIANETPNLTAFQLRLLLQPIQDHIWQARKLETLPPGTSQWSHDDNPIGVSKVILERVQIMLDRWEGVCDRYLTDDDFCPIMHSNLIMFHLVSLLALTNFAKIEEVARRGHAGLRELLNSHPGTLITDFDEAIHHSGQALRLIKLMDRELRPPWWAGAVYRVALILWCASLTNFGDASAIPMLSSISVSPNEQVYRIDFHEGGVDYLRWTSSLGAPALTRKDGSAIPLPDQTGVLEHCVEVIRMGLPSRFSDGICDKLTRLADEFRVG